MATQAFQHYANFVLRRMVLARRTPDILDGLLSAGFCGPAFCLIFASFDRAPMNQKSSLLNCQAFVSRPLMSDIRRTQSFLTDREGFIADDTFPIGKKSDLIAKDSMVTSETPTSARCAAISWINGFPQSRSPQNIEANPPF
ncbi:hypothetical protein CWR43_09195 [Rhizobium sullae]|uniref:Uncharacterized protein n=1 Tax=Rhizobium sullae TaxID=50338 RepID=A0A2N0DCH5_RHISU|nr:hypothetical protein CWR43_09195 [Rhizobium sullae]